MLFRSGMLLATDYKDQNGKDCVEVLNCSWANPGTPVMIEGADLSFTKPHEIDADTFFAVDIVVVNNIVTIDGHPLLVDGKPLKTIFTKNGGVH